MVDVSEDGYKQYETPDKVIAVSVLALTIVLGEAFFPGIIRWFYERTSTDLLGLAMVSIDEFLLLAGMVAIHEGIHFAVANWQGYSPEFGIKFFDTPWLIKEPSPYVITLNQRISRNDNIGMLIAPLVVIDGIALVGLLPVFPAIVGYYASVILVVNTASSMSDVYNVVRITQMKPGTEFINIEEEKIQTYYRSP